MSVEEKQLETPDTKKPEGESLRHEKTRRYHGGGAYAMAALYQKRAPPAPAKGKYRSQPWSPSASVTPSSRKV